MRLPDSAARVVPYVLLALALLGYVIIAVGHG